jgi:potassium channel subfamily K
VNAISLVCGVVGNIFLLLNFTQAVRYIIALPVTIILWFLATGMVRDNPISIWLIVY